MKPIAVDQAQAPAPAARASDAGGSQRLGALSRFFLQLLFALARHAPWALRVLRPLAVWGGTHCSAKIRLATRANARRIVGSDLSDARCAEFATRVVGHFYDFVVDVGRAASMTPQALRGQIEAIEGQDDYLAHRQRGGGAIILTAHMGSFEVGLAALAEVEPHVHVVFKRDAMDGFETIRRDLRQKLGVHEAPIDDGWETWLRLRDALERNHVVVMQGDRAMPGQKAQAVTVLGGHVMLPLGPIKLAQISGSPIVPVFAIRTASGRCRLFTQAPILIDPEARLIDGVHPALLEIGRVLEKFIAAYPEQWLVLEAAFVEDVTKPCEATPCP